MVVLETVNLILNLCTILLMVVTVGILLKRLSAFREIIVNMTARVDLNTSEMKQVKESVVDFRRAGKYLTQDFKATAEEVVEKVKEVKEIAEQTIAPVQGAVSVLPGQSVIVKAEEDKDGH